MRDRRIAAAAARSDWVLGFPDECWWTRPAQPNLSSGTGGDPLRLGANARDPKGGGPEAVACYGVRRADTGGMMPRFCDGRPVRATTGDFRGWVCRERAAEGKKVFVLVWDNAAWHVGTRVRAWVERHNRRVRRAKAGCRIRVCGLPVKAPWRNPIEPTGMHGKRTVAEPDRTVSADELRERVTAHPGGPPTPPLSRPVT